jgi:surface antigen
MKFTLKNSLLITASIMATMVASNVVANADMQEVRSHDTEFALAVIKGEIKFDEETTVEKPAEVKPAEVVAETKVEEKTKVITVAAGDTLYDLAQAHETDLAKLLELNEVADGGKLIHVGQEIRVPDLTPDVVETSEIQGAEVKPEDGLENFTAEIIDENNSYAYGQCTWFVKAALPWAGSFWGNGNQWADSARGEGFSVDTHAKAGSIIVFPGGNQGADATYGHVAVVESINPDGSINIAEGNAGHGLYSHRTVQNVGVEFIHSK